MKSPESKRFKWHWVAKFHSHPDLEQFPEGGGEHVLREVLVHHNDLKIFSLVNQENRAVISLDISNGLIHINSNQIPEPELLSDNRKFRLIYFRRNKVTFSTGLKELSRTVVYFLGYQYNDNQGRNHKKMIQIDENANITIGVQS